LQSYPTLSTTFSGAALNAILLCGMTWECRINGLALATLGSVAVNFSYKVMKDSADKRSPMHSLHVDVFTHINTLAKSIPSDPEYQVLESSRYTNPDMKSTIHHHRENIRVKLLRNTQLVLASLVSTVVLGFLNYFVLNIKGVGFLGVFALSTVPALYTHRVQILRIDNKGTNPSYHYR